MKLPNERPSGRRTIIHTDGACIPNPGPGGWGAMIRVLDGDHEISLTEISGGERDTTNNRMELRAGIEAVRTLTLEEGSPVLIYSDSKYVINGITEWLASWKARGWRTAAKEPVKNVDLWRELDGLTAFHDISWRWVKGLAGDPHNERVDQLANAAAVRASQHHHQRWHNETAEA